MMYEIDFLLLTVKLEAKSCNEAIEFAKRFLPKLMPDCITCLDTGESQGISLCESCRKLTIDDDQAYAGDDTLCKTCYDELKGEFKKQREEGLCDE